MQKPNFTSLKELSEEAGGHTLYKFSHWRMQGKKFTPIDERSFGPILWCQYTLSDHVMKMSVQFAPVGNDNRKSILKVNGKEIASASIDPEGHNVIFVV